MMPDSLPCDVLVIGAGPAGATAALAAARSGARVVLCDAKHRIGERPHCAGYIPARLALEFDIPTRAAAQPVKAMETRLPDRITITQAPGFIMDRDRFDHGLAQTAAQEGAKVMVGARLYDIHLAPNENHFLFKVPGGTVTINPQVAVAADGAGSRIRKLLKLPALNKLLGVQIEAPLRAGLNQTRIYFDPAYRHGYAWLFPKQNVANLGLGMTASGPDHPWRLLEALNRQLIQEGVIGPGELSRSVGAIPIDGPVEPLVKNKILFVGDAAGLTHPVTGAGLPQALISGRLAGRAAARFAQSGDPTALESYPLDILKQYGRTLSHALLKRREMETRWDNEDFCRLITRTWPAFPGYRHP